MKIVHIIANNQTFNFECSDIASDKSISHRSVMFSMLAKGKSVIKNFLKAEDTLNSLNIIKQLGAKVTEKNGIIFIESNGIKETETILDCGNSGTGMRLFSGLLASAKGHFVLTGDKYLKRRPMKRVTQPLREIGAKLDGRLNGDLAPLSIRGSVLKAFDYKSNIASAQVKSAMILAALSANGKSTYDEPELSRDHTERMLKGMGADLWIDESRTIHIQPLKLPLKPLDINIPADPSSAFFFAVAVAITPNAKIILKNITLNPTRIEAFKALEKMGTKINYIQKENKYEPIGDIIVEQRPLKAIIVDQNISWLIDEIPALSIAFAYANGKSIVKNAKELRVKESDRINTTVSNLKKCGIKTEESEDGFSVYGGVMKKSTINSAGDHRIAMSFAIAGIKTGMIIEDIACIDTSFPNFFTILNKIAGVEYEN